VTPRLPDPFPARCLIEPRLMSEPPAPPDYHVDGLVEKGTVLGIAGDSGTSKTPVTRALAIATVQGGVWRGRSVKTGRCVYLHGEDHLRSAVRQLRAMGWRESDTGLHYWCRPPLLLTEDAHRCAVREELERHEANLLVLDSASVLSGIDLNDNTGAAEFMGWVGDLANGLDLVAAVILHENKGNAYAGRSLAAARQAVLGAGQWRAQWHTLVSLELPDNARGQQQTREGVLDTWTVRVQLPKEREFGDGPEIRGLVKSVVPLANAEFLDERLPNSRVAVIDAGHFVCEEAPAEYASIVLDAITRSVLTAQATVNVLDTHDAAPTRMPNRSRRRDEPHRMLKGPGHPWQSVKGDRHVSRDRSINHDSATRGPDRSVTRSDSQYEIAPLILLGPLVKQALDGRDDRSELAVPQRPDQDHAGVRSLGLGPFASEGREVAAVAGDQDAMRGGQFEHARVVQSLDGCVCCEREHVVSGVAQRSADPLR
jgi:hypothetical protein